jgi:hypothetical protein
MSTHLFARKTFKELHWNTCATLDWTVASSRGNVMMTGKTEENSPGPQ